MPPGEPTSYEVSLGSIAASDTIVDNPSVAVGPVTGEEIGEDAGSERAIPIPKSAKPKNEGPLGVGDVVAGKYVVERVLGRGGMGQIVAAKHMELGTMVAIKIVLPEALGSEATAGRFKREALAMASLRSEHAVRIIDVGDLEGMPYIIMEYLEGNDLAAELRRRGPLPVREAVKYVLEAIDVLAEAHDIGIVHRDLKPGNLFLSWRPSKTRSVRVLDFGIAKPMVGAALADDVEPARRSNIDSVELPMPRRSRAPGKLTVAGMTLGTPNFMAPEQVSSGQIGPHTDVWGIGATLYTLLTGALPFTGPSLALTCGAVCTLPPTPPRQHRKEIPKELEAVILKCLNKAPSKRFMSIRELAAALEHASKVRAPSTTMGLRAPARADFDESDEELDGNDEEPSGELPPGGAPLVSSELATSRTTGDPRAPTIQIRALLQGRADPRLFAFAGAAAVVVVSALVLGAFYGATGARVARAESASVSRAAARSAAIAQAIAASTLRPKR